MKTKRPSVYDNLDCTDNNSSVAFTVSSSNSSLVSSANSSALNVMSSSENNHFDSMEQLKPFNIHATRNVVSCFEPRTIMYSNDSNDSEEKPPLPPKKNKHSKYDEIIFFIKNSHVHYMEFSP